MILTVTKIEFVNYTHDKYLVVCQGRRGDCVVVLINIYLPTLPAGLFPGQVLTLEEVDLLIFTAGETVKVA